MVCLYPKSCKVVCTHFIPINLTERDRAIRMVPLSSTCQDASTDMPATRLTSLVSIRVNWLTTCPRVTASERDFYLNANYIISSTDRLQEGSSLSALCRCIKKWKDVHLHCIFPFCLNQWCELRKTLRRLSVASLQLQQSCRTFYRDCYGKESRKWRARTHLPFHLLTHIRRGCFTDLRIGALARQFSVFR